MKASYVKLCELADEEVKHASTTKKSTFVGADLNLTHRADPIVTRGWKPTV